MLSHTFDLNSSKITVAAVYFEFVSRRSNGKLPSKRIDDVSSFVTVHWKTLTELWEKSETPNKMTSLIRQLQFWLPAENLFRSIGTKLDLLFSLANKEFPLPFTFSPEKKLEHLEGFSLDYQYSGCCENSFDIWDFYFTHRTSGNCHERTLTTGQAFLFHPQLGKPNMQYMDLLQWRKRIIEAVLTRLNESCPFPTPVQEIVASFFMDTEQWNVPAKHESSCISKELCINKKRKRE
jgi:hypothetical protein